MDEDFFKDYPPVDGAANDAAASSNPFDLGDAGLADAPAEPPIILGPSPDDMSDAHDLHDGNHVNNTLHDETNNATHDASDASDASENDDDDGSAAENPAVAQWRVQFAKRLEEKTLNEREVRAERVTRARDTLSTMHGRWTTSCAAAADANKGVERELIMNRDALISRMSKPGENPNWDIVPSLVDMTGKFKEGARDTSRMRQVLLRMKTT